MARSWLDMHKAGYRRGQLFPQLENSIEPSRGEQRLAAEVVIAELTGHRLAVDLHNKAFKILNALAGE